MIVRSEDDTDPGLRGESPFLSISVKRGVVRQHDEISGTLEVDGGRNEVAVNSLTIHLLEYSSKPSVGAKRPPNYKSSEVRHLMEDFKLPPHDRLEFAFVLALPPNARITSEEGGWMLQAQMNTKDGHVHAAKFRLEVRPAPELLWVTETWERMLGFKREESKLQWNPENGALLFRMMPPDALKQKLRYIELELLQDGQSGVGGNFTFRLANRSLMDHLLALFKLDVAKVPFSLNPQQMVDSDMRPDYVRLARQFDEYLRETIGESYRIRAQ